jgi:hypothetical protein
VRGVRIKDHLRIWQFLLQDVRVHGVDDHVLAPFTANVWG